MADIDDVKMEMGKKDDVTASNTARPTKEKSFYQKHKVVIWIVVALVVFAIAAGIGVGIAKALEDDLEYHRKVWFHGACPKDRESCPSGFDRAPLIVVGLNGFTGDIFDRHLAKHIHKLRECGAHTPNMSSMFPLSTYPNYYSIATGLYPDVHGIVDDYMVDEDYDTVWENGTDRSRPKDKVTAARWYKGEPIWATARKKHRNSAALLWPGSDVPIEAPSDCASTVPNTMATYTGVTVIWRTSWLPNYYYSHGGHMSFNDRVDRVVEWLEKSKSSRPDVIMLYMNATRYGTYKERREDLEDADEAVGRLMGGLTMLNLRDCSNVILVADWTLTNKSCNRVFNIDDYVTDLDNYQITPDWLNSVKRLNYTYNPYPNDYTDVVEYESTETTIEHFKCKNSFVQTYAKEELPVRLHYVNSPRIENIVMVGSRGYSLRTEDNSATRRQEWLCTGVAPEYFFNNLTSRMLFIGTGYAFRHNFTLETNFRSIELYNVMAELLDIEGDPNNGTEGAIRDSLREPKNLMRTLPQVSRPINALYPNDDMYELRIQDDGTDCNCDNIDQYFTGSQYDIDYFNDRLDVEDSKITDNRDDAPFGLPTIFNLTTEQPGNYSLLTNEEYIVAWDNYLKVPKYITYSLEKQYTNRGSFNEIINCIRQDVRLIDDYEPRCSDYELLGLHNITLGFMIYPASALTMRQQMDMLLTSNTAPMFKEFEKGIWKFLHEKYNDWADEFNGINIIIGPVFDTNHDGKLDTHEDMADSSFWIGSTPMPSHFFALLTRCKQGKLSQYCDYEDREYLSFVLPNVNEIKNCQNNYEYVKSHFVSIHDIEELTGLRFFPDMNFEEHLRIQLTTPELLWEDRSYRNNPWQ